MKKWQIWHDVKLYVNDSIPVLSKCRNVLKREKTTRDNFAIPHTLSLAYKASTFFDHGDPYIMNFF